MERFTISLDDRLAAEFGALIVERGMRHGRPNPIAVDLCDAPGDAHLHPEPSR